MAKKSKHPRVPATPRESEKEDGNPALVPKLRFPEFRGAGHWTTEITLMSDLHPLLTKRAGGREIAGLRGYES